MCTSPKPGELDLNTEKFYQRFRAIQLINNMCLLVISSPTWGSILIDHNVPHSRNLNQPASIQMFSTPLCGSSMNQSSLNLLMQFSLMLRSKHSQILSALPRHLPIG